ncbi:hypothetical protein CJ030_MR2G004070 [Morella rubra]|uniref:Uncharacterized protein n=1 Tax=Morella rubra TaxID=262757 RepID=A0A6A1WEU0_9ROSI|nr:hypothetical protein CJ030_MR2G004070 [Morella rubra]
MPTSPTTRKKPLSTNTLIESDPNYYCATAHPFIISKPITNLLPFELKPLCIIWTHSKIITYGNVQAMVSQDTTAST